MRLINHASLFLLLIVCWAAAALGGEKTLLSPAPEGSFSVVVIPDTQQYRGRGTKAQPDSENPVTNESLAADTRWIVDNLARQRIAFVSHVGDIVDKNVPEQWEVARRCMDTLQGHVPYAIAVGNHDMTSAGNSSLFQKYFPAARFAGCAWYGGTFSGSGKPGISANNADSFQLFSAAGMDFVMLHLECNAPDNVLQWADGVLDTHAQRRAMITTHMGLGPLQKPQTNAGYFHDPQGRMQWHKCHGERGNSPQQMWDKCFAKHANLFVVFSGDQSRMEAIRRADRGNTGKTIYELMSDYDDGWLRVYRFLPTENKIEAWTVDSRTGTLCTGTKHVPDVSQHRFTLAYDMTERKGKP
jgi:hypothetical protein